MTIADELTLIKHRLTSIRSEHSGKDVWNDFVVPRFYQQVDFVSTQPARIEGSRGSGKTMLLRYLAYQTQFSLNRQEIPINQIERVGLYWKADTQFLRMMNMRGFEESKWIDVFDHYLSLRLVLEAVDSLFAVAESRCQAFSVAQLEVVEIIGVRDYGFDKEDIFSIREELKSKLRITEMTIQNVIGLDSLLMVPPTFLSFFVSAINNSIPEVSNVKYFVYVDEYENLLPYQQRVINTRIKSSEPPLTFNIAIKKNGMPEAQTLGEEKIENVADFIIIDLDKMIFDHSYQVFLAEILLKRLADVSPTVFNALQFDPAILNDLGRLEERNTNEYKKQCKDAVTQILVQRTQQDLADEIHESSAYLKKLKSEIGKALLSRGVKDLESDDFISREHKKASIVCSSLLYRSSLDVSDVKAEFDKLAEGKANKFTNKTDWEKNNFIGCYLRIVNSNKAASTFYSGFDVYCTLSAGNVRHFLELCRSAFALLDKSEVAETEAFVLPSKIQHLAARNASEELFSEIQRFTPLGLQLAKLAEGLGVLFHNCQGSVLQSETEITHFGIKSSSDQLNERDQNIIRECQKWGVLRLDETTKEKSALSTGLYDYVLNPIYAPRFLISYRKGRKFELTASQFRMLYLEGKAAVGAILKSADQEVGGMKNQQESLL